MLRQDRLELARKNQKGKRPHGWIVIKLINEDKHTRSCLLKDRNEKNMKELMSQKETRTNFS